MKASRLRIRPVHVYSKDHARAQRNSPVEPARVSESARAKAADKRTPDGLLEIDPAKDVAM